MKRTTILRNVFLLIALSVSFTISAESRWYPEPNTHQPRWGETVTFTVTPTEGLDTRDLQNMRVAVQIFDADRNSRWLSTEIRRESGRLVTEVVIPKEASYLVAQILPESLPSALEIQKVYRPDGHLARGAFKNQLPWSMDREGDLQRELERYPDHLSTHCVFWGLEQADARGKLSAALRGRIEDFLKSEPASSDEGLYTAFCGHRILNQESKTKKALRELLDRHPTSPHLASAFSGFLSRGASQFSMETTEKVRRWALDHLAKYPDLPLGHNVLNAIPLETVELATAEAVLQAWREDEPNNALPLVQLARLYLEHRTNEAEGLQLAQTAVDWILNGRWASHDPTTLERADSVLSPIYRIASELAFRAGRTGDALAYVRAAQTLTDQTLPGLYDLEGELWESLDRPDRAHRAYEKAWMQGSASAEAKIAALRNTTAAPVDELGTCSPVLSETQGADRKDGPRIAPDFQLVALDGTPYRLEDLRGQVVILSFWTSGCLPSREWMPRVDRLAEEFADQEVIFLAPTHESSDLIREFLGDRSLTLDVVPDSHELATRYQIANSTSTLLIDKTGRIIYRRAGEDESILDQLRQAIARAL